MHDEPEMSNLCFFRESFLSAPGCFDQKAEVFDVVYQSWVPEDIADVVKSPQFVKNLRTGAECLQGTLRRSFGADCVRRRQLLTLRRKTAGRRSHTDIDAGTICCYWLRTKHQTRKCTSRYAGFEGQFLVDLGAWNFSLK